MPTLSRMKNFLRNIFAKRHNDGELDDEVNSYVDLPWAQIPTPLVKASRSTAEASPSSASFPQTVGSQRRRTCWLPLASGPGIPI